MVPLKTKNIDKGIKTKQFQLVLSFWPIFTIIIHTISIRVCFCLGGTSYCDFPASKQQRDFDTDFFKVINTKQEISLLFFYLRLGWWLEEDDPGGMEDISRTAGSWATTGLYLRPLCFLGDSSSKPPPPPSISPSSIFTFAFQDLSNIRQRV